MPAETPRSSWARMIRRILLFGVLAAVAAGAFCVYRGISTSFRAEENLHATLFAISLVDRFVSLHGRWPRSWEELEQLSVSNEPPMPMRGDLTVIRIGGTHGYDWPAASTEIQQRVHIDFDPDTAAIASQDPMDFMAIKPIGPYYEYRDYGYVDSLQSTIRAAARVDGEAIQ